jgi:hypothetical protein
LKKNGANNTNFTHLQVFWKLSPVENEIKMHPTLVRNPFGSNHETATRLANPLTKAEITTLATSNATAEDSGVKRYAIILSLSSITLV